MEWSELWDSGQAPDEGQIRDYVNSTLWEDLNTHLQQQYNASPKVAYSGCSMDGGQWKGWNVKYRKYGKALCTLYPKQKHFLVLLNIGAKEVAAADQLIPRCHEYTRKVYEESIPGANGKSLAIDVTDDGILGDVKELVALRAGKSTK